MITLHESYEIYDVIKYLYLIFTVCYLFVNLIDPLEVDPCWR